MKSILRAPRLAVDRDRRRDLRAVVHLVDERPVAQPVDHPPHLLRGIVLHVAHIGMHDREAELLDHAAQLLHAALVGGHLGLHVGDILLGVARRILAARQQRAQLRFEEPALIHQLEIVDQHALFRHLAAVRRHGARRDAADIGVMPAARDIEQDDLAAFVEPVLAEHRRDDGDVGQMRAAVVGRVQHIDIARHDGGLPVASRLAWMTVSTDSPIEPRCTGMCGALAISWPRWSNRAQEKSSRSLMFTE